MKKKEGFYKTLIANVLFLIFDLGLGFVSITEQIFCCKKLITYVAVRLIPLLHLKICFKDTMH